MFAEESIHRPVRTGGGVGLGLEPPNNFQTVLCFLYNSVLNEKEYNGQPPPPPPPNMNFVPMALIQWRNFSEEELTHVSSFIPNFENNQF